MYLMALDNIDYIILTLLFFVLFMVAYAYRRKNKTVTEFISGSNTPNVNHENQWFLGFGIIEFVLLGILGAKFGVSAFSSILLALIVAYGVRYYVMQVIAPDSIFEYLAHRVGRKFSVIYAILSLVLLMLLVSIAATLVAKLCLSLLGWNFVASVFAVFGFTLICLIIGGYKALCRTRLIQSVLIVLILLLVSILALHGVSPISSKFIVLEHLALSHGNLADYYVKFGYIWQLLYVLIPLLILLPLITIQKTIKPNNKLVLTLGKLFCIILMLLSGFFAILTPLPSNLDSQGNHIVTYQAQLPNGEMGYVVKSVGNESDIAMNDTVPGIIPSKLDAKTSLVINGSYDYNLASVVTMRHYLPGFAHVLVLLIIIVTFMLSLGQYLFTVAKIVVFDVYVPSGWLRAYGDEGLLWLSRMSMMFIGGASMFMANYLTPYIEMLWVRVLVFGLIGVLTFILFVVIVVYGKEEKK